MVRRESPQEGGVSAWGMTGLGWEVYREPEVECLVGLMCWLCKLWCSVGLVSA